MNFFKTAEYKNLNIVELNKENLVQNFDFFKNLSSSNSIFPVLKSNAYGHGLIQIASIVDTFNCEYIAVDSLYEAYELEKSDIKTPILIMDYTDPENFKIKKLPFSFVVYDIQSLQVLNEYQKNARVHIKIDSGMHRLGIQLDEASQFIGKMKDLKNIQVEGIMSHFADADNIEDESMIQKQIQYFKRAIEIFEDSGYSFKYKHINASAGALRVNEEEFNASRVGIGLYGISPIEKYQQFLKPVMSLKSHIIQVKEIKEGESVGYNATYKAEKDMRIAVIPVGYYEGLDRRLSNKGFVTIDNIECPIIGRVSMNMGIISLENTDTKVGDEVVVYSSDPIARNSIINAAKISGTIPYELLVKVNASIKRTII